MSSPIARICRNTALLVLLAIVALAGDRASAQGFMVKPMRVDVAPVAGRLFEVPIEIYNTSGEGVRDIEFRLVELAQADDGSWKSVDPATVSASTNLMHSSLAWTSLSASTLAIPPLQSGTVTVRLAVPRDARGAYSAGLIAETPAPPGATGVTVRIRFLIPLTVQIAGRAGRQQVALKSAELVFEEGAADSKPRTLGTITVANEGRTLSRVAGTLTIERQGEEGWRGVTRINIPERSILPGATLKLGGDLQRKVPRGTYRLRAEAQVDGRRIPPLVTEAPFEGDPAADDLAYDTALLMEPSEVALEVVPGATRTAVVSIVNPGADPIDVAITSRTPRSLGGVEMGNVRGIDLSAEPWTQIQPATFKLRPGGKQNVRVISRIPRERMQYPNYYADLVVSGIYQGGESAGETRSTVHLAYAGADNVVDGMVEAFTLFETSTPGVFAVQARLANIGNVHVFPTASVVLLSEKGVSLRRETMNGEGGMLLPLGNRTYGAELPFADLGPGRYALRVIFSIAPGRDVVRQLTVNVGGLAAEGAGPAVTVDGPPADVLEDAGVTAPQAEIEK